MASSFNLSQLYEHVEQAFDHHMTMENQELLILEHVTELERWLLNHYLVQVFRVMKVAIGRKVVG